MTVIGRTLALALTLSGCSVVPAPNFCGSGCYRGTGDGRVAEAIQRNRERAIASREDAAERLWRWRVLRELGKLDD